MLGSVYTRLGNELAGQEAAVIVRRVRPLLSLAGQRPNMQDMLSRLRMTKEAVLQETLTALPQTDLQSCSCLQMLFG